jgi:KipI family sensor histidine kinase inhibitor
MRILPFGDSAVLAEYASLAEVRAAARALAAARPRGVVDIVPAARTVLVRLHPAELPLAAAERWIREASESPAVSGATGDVVVLPVRYDGPDLGDTAELLGSTVAELVRRHSGALWESAFSGFAPGFAYLVSDDLDLAVPRLPTARQRVPPGAVGVAGEFSGVYPRESPGGWRLLGTTDAALWDESRTPPALLPPGTRVRFEAVP